MVVRTLPVTTIPLHDFRIRPERPLPCEVARLESLPRAARASYPNRHTFYEVFWITGGGGVHYIDFEAYPVRPQTLFFIAPGQVHAWQMPDPARGYALLFLPELFPPTGEGRTVLDDLSLFRPGECPPTVDPGEAAAEVDGLVAALHAEYHAAQFGQLTVLQALMQVLLIRAQRLLLPDAQPSERNAASGLTRRFLRLVEGQFAEQHTVAGYAAGLGVTAGHLTDSVRQALGVSAGTVIHRRLALEAKRLLAHSDDSVGAVAQRLHFDDASYFGRFFKQQTGHSPEAFRRGFRTLS